MNFNFVYNWNLLFLWKDEDIKEGFDKEGEAGSIKGFSWDSRSDPADAKN